MLRLLVSGWVLLCTSLAGWLSLPASPNQHIFLGDFMSVSSPLTGVTPPLQLLGN